MKYLNAGRHVLFIILGFVVYGGLRYAARNISFSSIPPVVLILFVGGFFVVLGLPLSMSRLRLYMGVTKRRETDISHEQRPYPSQDKRIPRELEALAFERIGETTVDLPGKKEVTAWIFKNSTGTIIAEAAYFPGNPPFEMVNFSSWFPGERVVETSYPVGDNITTENYHSTYNDQSLDLALLMHAIEMEMFQQRYGDPVQLHSMADILFYNKIYRQKHARRRLRPKLIQSIATFLGIIYGVVLPVALYAVAATNFNYIYDVLLLMPVLIIGLFLFLLFLWSHGLIGIRIKKAL